MVQWHFVQFNELTIPQLYELLQLRAAVFVVEQNCVYQDLDGWDDKAIHCLGVDVQNSNALVAYARIFLPDIRFTGHSSIGRILTSETARGNGTGRALVQACIQWLQLHAPEHSIKIQAQDYLRAFYSSFGFKVTSAVYPEDGIPHVDMLLHFK